MSNSSPTVQTDEFNFCTPTLRICAPTSMSDEEGEKLYEEMEPIIEGLLAVFKAQIEGKFDKVRVGYDVN